MLLRRLGVERRYMNSYRESKSWLPVHKHVQPQSLDLTGGLRMTWMSQSFGKCWCNVYTLLLQNKVGNKMLELDHSPQPTGKNGRADRHDNKKQK